MSVETRHRIDPNNNTQSIQPDSLDKIERIRDLIVGPQMRDLLQKFDSISRDLTRVESEIKRVSNELKEQSNKAQKNIQELEQRLSSQLKEQDAQHLKKVDSTENTLSGQIQGVEERFSGRVQDVLSDLRTLQDETRNEIRQTINGMEQSKMDTFSLGELFSKLGEGLKTSAPGAELNVLLDALQDEIS